MNKNIFYAIALVVVIIIGFFIYHSFQSVSGSFSENSIGIDAKTVSEFSIYSSGSEITFEKKDSVWSISKPIQDLADQNKVGNLIKDFSDAKLVAPVSSNPEKQEIFGVDSSANKIKFGNKLIYVGKVGPDFQTTYLRLDGSNQVNIFTGMLSSSINSSVNNFRNKEVLKLDEKKIKSIDFKSNSENFTCKKDSADWSVDGVKIEQSKIYPMISTVSDLSGDDIIDTLKISDLKQLVKSVSVTVNSDKIETVNFFKIPGKLNYIANKEGSDRIYSLQEYKVERFFKSKSYWISTENK